MESDVSQHFGNKCFSALSIQMVEKWDAQRYGVFNYAPPWSPFSAHNRVSHERRNFFAVIQCQVDVVGRMLVYLREKYGEEAEFELSLSPITACQDRLILLFVPPNSGSQPICGRRVLEKILLDRIVTYALSRIYVLGDSPIVTSTLSEMVMEMMKKNSISGKSVRMHAFPKFLPLEKIAQEFVDLSNGDVEFNPKSYDHVMNIVYVNGLWYSSFLQVEEAIGSGTHLYKGGSDSCLKVSKASQKIFEAINRWSVGGQIKDINTCLDIGASPGGWSYYMALELKACRVIAVDNGALATPKPPAVEHWKMKGEDAIDVLLANQLAANQLISIYTCDMNADPIVTVDLFLRAIPIMAVRGLVVLTLKRTIKNKEKWQMRKEECISKLHSELGERLIRLLEIHLIANTPNETTIMIQLG
jgi:hypothetical protein